MKKTFLFLTAFGLVSLFVSSAQASRDEYYEYGERGERYEYNRPYSGGERYEAYKFYGTIEAMPPAGIAGIWRISGRDVVVNQNTFIKQEYGRVGVGARVEVKGSGNPLMAYEIEVKGGAVLPGNPMNPPLPAMAGANFAGTVEGLPPVGFMGTWRVAGRDVIVNQNTRIKQENGLISVGADVEVKGGGTPFIAYEIESKKGSTR